MRSGWRVVGVMLAILAVLACARLRADAPPPVEAPPPADISDADRTRLKNEVANGDFENAENALEQLRKKTLEKTWGKPLLDKDASLEDLQREFNAALDAGQYGVAQYYLERIRSKSETPPIFKPALDLTVWTVVVFLLLLGVLYKFAWKPMLQGLQKREHDIHAAVEDARKAREEATRLREEMQAERAKIEEMRRDIIQKAQADAQRTADEILSKAKADMQAERDRMRRELESMRDQTLQELMNYITNLAALVSTKAIRRNLTPEDHRRLVDEALAELRQAGDGQRTPVGV